ncbi:hypothetical protein K2X30_15615 [bacterium]|jgi:hypothetical protein|nr:hypothetical protein [bacterium]
MKFKKIVFLPLFVSVLSSANPPFPPRSIRVVPSVKGSCAESLQTQAKESMKKSQEVYGISEEEARALFYSTVIGGEVTAKAISRLYGDLNQLNTHTKMELDVRTQGIMTATGIPAYLSELIALIRFASEDKSNENKLHAALDNFYVFMFERHAEVVGCSKQN